MALYKAKYQDTLGLIRSSGKSLDLVIYLRRWYNIDKKTRSNKKFGRMGWLNITENKLTNEGNDKKVNEKVYLK